MKIIWASALTMILSFVSFVASAQELGAGSVPTLCKPCVFYGGDNNEKDPNSTGFLNGDTLLVGTVFLYAPVDVPKNVHGVVTGILFMTISTIEGNVFDPATATYDIRTGVSNGNAGKSVASGSGPMTSALDGQFGGFFPIYETAVNLTTPFTVTPGTRYWFNMTPQCTNSSNANCSSVEFLAANTTQETNGLNAGAQPPFQLFGGIPNNTLENICNGNNSPACERASFGLLGHP